MNDSDMYGHGKRPSLWRNTVDGQLYVLTCSFPAGTRCTGYTHHATNYFTRERHQVKYATGRWSLGAFERVAELFHSPMV